MSIDIAVGKVVQIIAAIGVTGAMMFGLTACASSGDSAADTAEAEGNAVITVVASINQWGSVAKDLGGDRVEVTNIMTSTNVEAHDYEPSSADIAKFTKAQVAVINGADYDPWASKAAESTKATLVNAAETDGIKEGDNPHVWFSKDVREKTADAITAAYEKAMPDQKDYFEQQRDAWQEKEDKVKSTIKAASASTKDLPYAASESVAYYLAKDLGMKDATPSGYANASANESEPSPADIKQYVDALEGGSIKLFVLNTQEANSTTDQLVSAAEKGKVPVVKLTEQMPSQYQNLTDWMDALAGQFGEATK